MDSMAAAKTIALFPEASYGAALNCVGIAQELRRLGAQPVFICHPGFSGVFAEYGFPEYQLDDTGSAGPAGQTDWNDFIAKHQHAFKQDPFDQLSSYVGPTWDAIVETAIRAEAPLRQLLTRMKPDAIVLDNVVMFPAIANFGVPWIRIVSCAETELADPLVPPYLSGCGEHDHKGWKTFGDAYERVTAPAHRRFAAFLQDCGLKPPEAPSFLDPSPFLNLLLAPSIIRHQREIPLDPERFVFLDGCVRQETAWQPPRFASHNDQPLVLVSFGSLGAMDVEMMQRMIDVFATLPYRFLVNAGHWRDEYSHVPDNVFLDSWYPQPSVVDQAGLFIHHGGNNSFCEALYFGVPSIVMPYCWDGHDNARRAMETGVGTRLDRYRWTETQLADAVRDLLGDRAMNDRLKANSVIMKAENGTSVAASAILDVIEQSRKNRRKAM